MKMIYLFLFIAVLCFSLISCDNSSSNLEEASFNNDTSFSTNILIKPTENPCYIRLATSKNSYNKNEKVELLLYIGYDSNIRPEHEKYKVVFNVTDDIELVTNNELLLNDYPGERWFLHNNSSTNLWINLPEPIVIEIDPLELLNTKRGTIRAEIVGEGIALNDVSSFQGVLYFNSVGDEVMFSIHSNDSILE